MFGFKKSMTAQELAEEARIALDRGFRSAILYGSSAAGDHLGKASDCNMLIVADDLDMERLAALSDPFRRWTACGNPPPLLFTEKRLREAGDVFPIEMLDMLQARKVLLGDDVLEGMEVSRENLRHQVEFELRSKLLKLREGCVSTGCDRIGLRNILLGSCSSILAVMRAALRLYTDEVPADKLAAVKELAVHIPFDTSAFETIVAAKKGGKPIADSDAERVFESYLRQIEAVTDAVDAL